MLEKLKQTTNFLQQQGITKPKIGIVLGTGLGNLVTKIQIEKEISYTDIPNFPVATVEFHSGKLIYGKIEGKQVLVMQGRFHYYEGYDFQQITFAIRVLKQLGVQNLLISNAAGGVNTSYKKGDLAVIDDHINLQGGSPLIGKNHNELGPRFVDMVAPYDKGLNDKLIVIAKQQNQTLHTAVYAAVKGPELETRAEYRMMGRLGADLVGMSTVPEVIIANHMSLPCCAVSVVTDECDPDKLQPVNIEEIIAVAGKAEVNLTKLFVELIKQI